MILIWGIDSADWEVVEPLIEQGELPALGKLVDTGTSGTLRSTIPAYTGIALPTLMTGKNPGTTGMVGFKQVSGELNDFTDLDSEAFWETAGRQNTDSCIVNVRTTYPPRPVENGWLVSGDLYTPPDADDFVYPEGLTEECPDLGQFHEELGQLDTLQQEGDIEGFTQTAIRSTRRRYEAFRSLVENKEPAVAMFWIGNADKLKHLAWGEPVIEEYYREIDTLLADALDQFEPTVTYVLSDHGHEAAYDRELHLNTWLAREGYLETTAVAPLSRRVGPYISQYGPDWLKNGAQAVVQRLKGSENDDETPAETEPTVQRSVTVPGLDYEQSRAVLANEWGIDVLVDGPQREQTVEQLVTDLQNLRVDGEPAIRFVAPREEVYTGQYLDAFPDVIVLPAQGLHTNHTLASELTTRSSGSEHNAGTHIFVPDGIFVAAGEGIEQATDLTVAAEDLAPTVLHALGLGVPSDMDGSPVEQILPPARRGQPVEQIDPVDPQNTAAGTVDDQVEQRLEDMGYL